jgi:signal transduction histidine kinase
VAWSAVVVAFALGIAGAVLLLASDASAAGHGTLLDLLWLPTFVAWATVGALVASKQPRNPIGWILCVLALFAGVDAFAEGLVNFQGSRTWRETGEWLNNWTWIPFVFVPLAFLPLYFPDGRLTSTRWRIVPWCAGLGVAAFTFSEAFTPGPLESNSEVDNPYGLDSIAVDVAGFGFVLSAAAILAGVASLVVRFRRVEGVERQQIKWLALAGCFAAATFAAGAPVSIWSATVANVLIVLGVFGLPIAIGVAVLRYRLYDIDLLINRTLVYGGLTVAVVGIYVALVGGLSEVFHKRGGFWFALLATGLAALLVQPLRSGLQRRVNRVMYGPTDDTRGTSGLRGHLHDAFVPEVGELQRSRERLVTTREEERRRLRRDLHDGLGPALAGAALKVEAAENLLASDLDGASGLLQDARAEIQDAVAEVRRLVYALRPPALDELGLVGALREQAQRLGVGERVRVEVDAPEQLDGLPAAVEVAAYRIAMEAMTNVARHAHAHVCRVRLSVNGALELEISDDGHGLPSGHRAGVGLTSMHERADELGGTCTVERIDGSGTRVSARLPLEVT